MGEGGGVELMKGREIYRGLKGRERGDSERG